MKATLKVFEKHNRGILSLMSELINESDPYYFDFVTDPKNDDFDEQIKKEK